MLNGVELVVDPAGLVWWPAQRVLAVADLHLEKGSSYARKGKLLPPYDSRATLNRLADVLVRLSPARTLCLGDSFHDAGAEERVAPGDRDLLRSLTSSVEWVWICGNHDPHPSTALGGKVMTELVLGPLVFRHQAVSERAMGEVSGHFHPKIGITIRGRHVSGRCFVHDGRRLILPAFGAYAGGLDVRNRAIASLFPTGFQADVIGRERLFRFRIC